MDQLRDNAAICRIVASCNQEALLPSEREPDVLSPSQMSDGFQITPELDAAISAIGRLHASPLESFATVRHFETASAVLECLHSQPLVGPRWAFRGHANADWKLAPSIERLKREYSHGIRTDSEDYVRHAFKRRAHHYRRDLPGDQDELEWLALMRHHGAPTRLLDWTSSPYVAAFFAVADAREKETSAIWAIDIPAIKDEALTLLIEGGSLERPADTRFSFSDHDVFNRVFMQETKPAIVAPVQPFRSDERATAQQGLFLCPNSLDLGFEFGLKQVIKSRQDRMEKSWREMLPPDEVEPAKSDPLFKPLYKLTIASLARVELLRGLHRMNISYATLFPGLDGFARSLNTNVTLSDKDSLFDVFEGEFDSRI